MHGSSKNIMLFLSLVFLGGLVGCGSASHRASHAEDAPKAGQTGGGGAGGEDSPGGAEEGAGGASCIPGDESCACLEGETCSEGLFCIEDTCITCTNDTPGCPCEPSDASEDAPLVCLEGLLCDFQTERCVERHSPCFEAGCLEHQACYQVGESLACQTAECEPGFLWHEESGRCLPKENANCAAGQRGSILSACLSLGRSCGEVQGITQCLGCLSGNINEGSMCKDPSRAPYRCEDLNCQAENRRCTEGWQEDDATCGDCLEGHVKLWPDSPSCTEVEQACEACANENRMCDREAESVCTTCARGFVENAEGVCTQEAESCEALDCEGRLNRPCQLDLETGVPFCEERCFLEQTPEGEPLIWDREVQVCRQRFTCDMLGCENCIQRRADSDATCGCEGNQGFEIIEEECAPCANQVPDCSGEQYTGHIIKYLNRQCFCEPSKPYFWSHTAERFLLCDADEDGWTNSEVYSSLTYGNAENPIHRKIRSFTDQQCQVRKVKGFKLMGEEGGFNQEFLRAGWDTLETQDLVPLFEGGGPILPLFESPRNDGIREELEEQDDLPKYPEDTQRRNNPPLLATRFINSLTKACFSESGTSDFNDNGISDVEEWDGMALGDNHPNLEGLIPVYALYRKYSYFLELYDGWFVPEAAGSRFGHYFIKERSRKPDASFSRVPVGMPEYTWDIYEGMDDNMRAEEPWYLRDSVPGREGDSYWRVCERRMDTDYQSVPGVHASDDEVNRAGGDFSHTDFHVQGEPIFKHHSQFKCVSLMSRQDYERNADGVALNKYDNPTAVILKPGRKALKRLIPSNLDGVPPREESLKWLINHCAISQEVKTAQDVQGEMSAVPAGYNNPEFPVFTCTTPGSNTRIEEPNGHAYWAMVGYENNASEGDLPDYERGCVNVCGEYEVKACEVCAEQGLSSCYVDEDELMSYGVQENPARDIRYTCDDSFQYAHGQLRCGCGYNYARPREGCTTSCAGAGPGSRSFGELFYGGSRNNQSFDVETRSGIWMCASPRGSMSFLQGANHQASGAPVTEVTSGGHRYLLEGSIPITGTDGKPLATGIIRGHAYQIWTR